MRTLRTNAHPGNAAVGKIQVYAHLKNVFMTNKHRNVSITSITLSVHSQVIVDSARECWATLCLVYGGCTGYALRRGDLHSGTLRDGNHKPTIPSAGALGLNLSTDQNGVESVEFMGGRARRKAVWLAESFTKIKDMKAGTILKWRVND